MVTIVLSETQHRCLMDHLSQQSHAYKALETAHYLSGSVDVPEHYVVECELEDAHALLAAAELDCHTAVHSIKIGLRQERVPPKNLAG